MAHRMKFVALTAVLCCSLMPAVTATFWGDWGKVEYCPDDERAVGFKLKTEKWQGGNDDTALNAISLKCSGGKWITSTEGRWGDWGKEFICPEFYWLTACQLRVEPKQGDGDDSAANNLNCMCSNIDDAFTDEGSWRESTLVGDGLSWGEWDGWSSTCDKGICSLQTRVQEWQGNDDDTALNDVKFTCCDERGDERGDE